MPRRPKDLYLISVDSVQWIGLKTIRTSWDVGLVPIEDKPIQFGCEILDERIRRRADVGLLRTKDPCRARTTLVGIEKPCQIWFLQANEDNIMFSKPLPDYLSAISRLNILFAWNIEFYISNSHQHIIRLSACVIQLCWFKRKEQAVFLEATWPIISTVNNFPKSGTFQVFPRPCLALPLPSNLKC